MRADGGADGQAATGQAANGPAEGATRRGALALGALAGLTAAEVLSALAARGPVDAARLPYGPGEGAPHWSAVGVGELREVPGIGPARARALVEARWRAPAPAGELSRGDLEAAPGIGPKTATALAAWLAARGIAVRSPADGR